MPERRPMVLEPLRRTVADAQVFANVAHGTQMDKAGEPYINHLARVAKSVGRMMFMHGHARNSRELDEAAQIAWLHDVIEDTEYGNLHLQAEGFAPDVVAGVQTLTRPKWMPYPDFINGVCLLADLPTLLVKIADLEDNLDPARLALLPGDVRVGIKRDRVPALPVLKAAAERLGWKGERS